MYHEDESSWRRYYTAALKASIAVGAEAAVSVRFAVEVADQSCRAERKRFPEGVDDKSFRTIVRDACQKPVPYEVLRGRFMDAAAAAFDAEMDRAVVERDIEIVEVDGVNMYEAGIPF